MQPWQHRLLCRCVWDHLCTLLLIVIMAKVSNYSRNRIEILHKQGLHPAEILKALKHEGLLVSFSSITRIIKKLRLTGSVANLPRSGRPQKLSTEAKTFVDQQMRRDDETTSNTIKKKLERHGICVSASTIRRARKQQGWTLQRTAYCQLIRDANKVKRLNTLKTFSAPSG